MLKNYDIDPNGVIYQKEKTLIPYNTEYILNSYDSYGESTNYMSYLRLGYVVGTLNYVPKSLLDVGYGNGNFLKACKTLIKECYGHDISGYPLPDHCTFIEDITSRHFDVITFFDSLEHMVDISFVKDLQCNYVCISVPWCHYHSDDWFNRWKHRRENEHLYHFNDVSLKNYMQEMGFELITYSNIEDSIRRGVNSDKNILTAIFKKIHG